MGPPIYATGSSTTQDIPARERWLDPSMPLSKVNSGTGSMQGNDLMEYTFRLENNYPNPFNPATTINYSIEGNNYVSIIVYDVLGREVAKLVDGYRVAGQHTVVFDAGGLSSGTYFYTLRTGDFFQSKKMVLTK